MARRAGKGCLHGVRKNRSIGHRPSHSKISTKERRLIRMGKLIPNKDYLLGKRSAQKGVENV